jgi:hypothetical protein
MEMSSQFQVLIAVPPPMYWIESLVGQKTGHCGEEKNLLPLQGSTQISSVVQPIAYLVY